MKKVLFAIAFAIVGAFTVSVSAATINVTFGEKVYALDVAKTCAKVGKGVTKDGYQLPVKRTATGQLVVGTETFPFKCGRKIAGGGGGTITVQQGIHTGPTAEEVAEDLGLPPGSVGTIDPGPVAAHDGVVDTDNDGDSNDEANAATAEGATQSDAQPDAGTTGDTTNGGNDGVDIF